jgi:two-component SAPR family response regulator
MPVNDREDTFGAVQTYHGEPAPELTAAIWAEAKRRYPEPTQQSIFNDACHWLIQRVKGAQAELKRLRDLHEKMSPWTDRQAFVEFNRQMSAAYQTATAALAEIVGDDAIETLWYVAPEAHDGADEHEVSE